MDRVDYQSMIIQDLVNDYNEKKLNLNPWYQRRSVWSEPQKSYLINTILERKPLPALYIRHSIDLEKGKSVKEVVDGQQRSRAILEFYEGRYAARADANAPKRKYSDFSPIEKERFLLTPISIGFLLGADDRDVIDIFARINSVSKSLNIQEKRNARYSGEFKQFALNQATSRLDFWRNLNIFSANDIARMDEVAFTSDIILNLLKGLSDYRPAAIDDLYKKNDNNFADRDVISKRLNNVFEQLYKIDKSAITETIFQRQPLIFSLIIALDSLKNVSSERLQAALFEMDAAVKDDDLKTEPVENFRTAIASSTQRLASRTTRDNFMKSYLKK
ncbi:hypothetical protein BV97_03464 [Novosphingobium resinovorum]|uniref:GmrSD restriction endonucleases N-terminal domain-containing protein n=1 Tax=Novosphingobium resinovorum TaxID=158500 RepID=A0A031JVI9_9SPHN|nr:DUF262 domain-containing protein [Novosphingobium resinovorum]EZP80377.1 hypothetical protein BV97_03464 [Novosphingobium resinovorum]